MSLDQYIESGLSKKDSLDSINDEFRVMLSDLARRNPIDLLVCEDDSDVREAFRRNLGQSQIREFFKLRLTESVEEGRSELVSRHPNVLVTDLKFGGVLEGESLIQDALRIGAIEVVAFSGFINDLCGDYKSKGVRMVQKAAGEAEGFWVWLRNYPLAHAFDQFKRPEKSSVKSIESPTVEACKRLFSTWARGLDKELILNFGRLELDSAGMQEHVEESTSVGEELLRLFVEDLQDDLLSARGGGGK